MKWWGKHVKVCLEILDKSTPKEWLLPADKLPSKEQLNVVNVPKTSGILTEEEVFITEQDVAALLEAYQSGRWTVRQVVTAFLKKAVIMHQLVCPISIEKNQTSGEFALLTDLCPLTRQTS